MTLDWMATADRLSPWREATVVVAGLGTSGFAAADGLIALGAGRIIVLDDLDSAANLERADLLGRLDVEVRLGAGATAELPEGVHLVITSPGWRPTAPLLAQAAARGLPRWGEVERGWRMMQPDRVVPWLAVTGTNGKTTTVNMLESILRAAGLTTSAVGNVGRPIVEAVLDDVAYDVLAVELSSFQLHWTHSLALHSAAITNLQPDHLEWYAHEADPMAAYAADKARIFERVTHSCVYNVADPATRAMVEAADVAEGARAIGFSLGVPGLSELGVVDDLLVDRAFIAQRRDSALPLAATADVRPNAPHNVENALAAAALARSFGVGPQAVAEGLRSLRLGDHRLHTVAGPARGPGGDATPGPHHPPAATTASRPWRTPPASGGSTTARPPTRTRRRPPCGRSTASCGSPAGRPRARPSTSSSPGTASDCAARYSSASTATTSRTPSHDTRRGSRGSSWTPVRLG